MNHIFHTNITYLYATTELKLPVNSMKENINHSIMAIVINSQQ